MFENQENLDLDFVKFVIASLASHPEDIDIQKTIDNLGVLITLQAHKDDMGRIIGKNGQTIKSIRTLLKVIGAKQEQRINLKILEPKE